MLPEGGTLKRILRYVSRSPKLITFNPTLQHSLLRLLLPPRINLVIDDVCLRLEFCSPQRRTNCVREAEEQSHKRDEVEHERHHAESTRTHQPILLFMTKKGDVRSVFRSTVLNEGRTLSLGHALQIEVARMPARTGLMPIIKEEQDGAHRRDEVQRKGQGVAEQAVR